MAQGPQDEAEMIEAIAHIIRHWASNPRADWRAHREARQVRAIVESFQRARQKVAVEHLTYQVDAMDDSRDRPAFKLPEEALRAGRREMQRGADGPISPVSYEASALALISALEALGWSVSPCASPARRS